MRRRARTGLAVVAAVLALAGCTETPTVVRTPPAAGSSDPMAVPPEVTAAPNPDLGAAKRAAGIAACPVLDAAPARGGLPEATLQCLGGGAPVDLAALRGPRLVNVWASWCTACRAEAPVLAEVARAGSAVSVIGVDHADPAPDAAVAFAAGAGWTYPQLYDADLVFRTKLQVTALPVTFFLRADGSLAGRHAGPFTSRQQLDDASRRYLGVTP